MPVILQNLSEKTVNTFLMVLESSGIAYELEKDALGWQISVHSIDEQRALKTIAQYLEENQNRDFPKNDGLFVYGKTWSGLIAALVLPIINAVVKATGHRTDIIKNYGSSASQIIDGEYYRTITALFLHGDALHIIGNMAGIALFGTAVCSITGWGAGWLIILFTGSIGNLLNAYFYQTGHLSIGASTAVFGSIGFLSACQFIVKVRIPGQKLRAWISIAAGLALLGILGSSEFTDIMAHFFGFLAGVLLGLFYRTYISYPIPFMFQVACLVIALGLSASSWIFGFLS